VQRQATYGGGPAPDAFTRLHRSFVEHFGYAVTFAWAAAVYAAWHAPWVHNIRGLIDPTSRVESTASYLFALPIVMTLALAIVACGGETIRQAQLVKNHVWEFAFAGLIGFAVFCLAINRAVAAFLLAQ
jgi:hypothetical protein